MGKQKKGKRVKADEKKSRQPDLPVATTTRNSRNKAKQQRKKGGKKNQDNLQIEEDTKFRASLEQDGRYTIVEMDADGNCLFRSLSDQLHQDHGAAHHDVRHAVCDFIADHEEEYSAFLVLDESETDDEDAVDFESYVDKMKVDGEWGGNLELVAAAKFYRRNITVFSANLSAMNIGHGEKTSFGADLLLSYHDDLHYNSVRDNNAKSKPISSSKDIMHSKEHGNGIKETELRGSTLTSNNQHDKEYADVELLQFAPEADNDRTREANTDGQPGRSDGKRSRRGPTKNATCPCGSGQKYKKCCLAKAKREARLKKMKDISPTKESSSDAETEPNSVFETCEMKFRSITI